MFTESVTYPAAFLSGLLSFFSPCVLPLIPAYFTFISGYSLDDLTGRSIGGLRRRVFFSTVAFVTGFSVVFILMGASASFLGGLLYKYRDIVRIIGGLVIIVLGVHLTGLIRIPQLDIEKRVHLERKPLHLAGTLIVGMAFGVGWSPCIGPLLGSILVIAGSQETIRQGMILLGIYSAGLALPFIMLSVFIHFLLSFIRRTTRSIKLLNLAAGVLLIAVGIVLLSNKLYLIAASLL